MQCEYYRHELGAPRCHSGSLPSQPSAICELHYCTTERHRFCPLYRHPTGELAGAIRQEICRAIG